MSQLFRIDPGNKNWEPMMPGIIGWLCLSTTVFLLLAPGVIARRSQTILKVAQDSIRGRKPDDPPPPRRPVNEEDESQFPGRALGGTSATSTTGQPLQRSVIISEPAAEAGPSMFRSQTSFVGGQNQFDNHQGNRTSITVHIHKSDTVHALLDPENPNPRTSPSSQDVRGTPSAHHPNDNMGSLTNAPREPQRAGNKLYELHFMQKRRGYPLWIPQVNLELPEPYRAVGPCVGDVGLITPSGAFDFLFNVCRPHDDPINPEELPENFTPIHPPLKPAEVRKFREFNSGSYLVSSSIAMSQLESQTPEFIFESSATDGAILTMPEGAYQEELRNVEKFRDYIATHAEDWYRFVNRTLGCEAQNGDLRLVVGSDKSTSWGMAAFVNVSQQQNFRLKFHVLDDENRTSTGPMSVWEHSGMADAVARSGPDKGEKDELGTTLDHPLRNQCLFVRTLNISLPDDAWKRANQKSIRVADDVSTKKPMGAKSNASPSISGGQGKGTASSGQGSCESTGSAGNFGQAILLDDIFPSQITVHPSKVINNFLLKQKPEAVVAITHDRDWYNLMDAEDEAFPDSSTLLDRISATNDVCLNNGVVYLQLKGPSAEDRDSEQQELLNLAKEFKTGQMTLERYLFGDYADYAAQLSEFTSFATTMISSSHVHDNMEKVARSIPPRLVEVRRRLVPLDDLISLVRGSKRVGELTEDAITAYPTLFFETPVGDLTGSNQARIAFGLHQRYVRLNQIDDLEELIVIYHNLVTFRSNPHLHLEALLGLAPLLHRRYLIKNLSEDLHSLIQTLKVQASLDFKLILQPIQQDIDLAILSSNEDSSLSKSQKSKNDSASFGLPRSLDQTKQDLLFETLSDDIPHPPVHHSVNVMQTRVRSTKGTGFTSSTLKSHQPEIGHSHHKEAHSHSQSGFRDSHSHGKGVSIKGGDKTIAAPDVFLLTLPIFLSVSLAILCSRGSYIILIGLCSNVVLTGAKGLVGWHMHSASLLVNARHSLSDLLGDFVTLFCWRLSRKRPSECHPYGFAKFQTLGTTTISIFLIGGALGKGFHSYHLLMAALSEAAASHPPGRMHDIFQNVIFNGPIPHIRYGQAYSVDPNAAWFALVSIVSKEWLYQVTKYVADEEKSSLLLANAIHHRSDAYSNLVALFAILGSWFFPAFPLDLIGEFIASIVILLQGFDLFKGAYADLTDMGVPLHTKQSLVEILNPLMKAPCLEQNNTGIAYPALFEIQQLQAHYVDSFIFVDLIAKVSGAMTAAQKSTLKEKITQTLKEARKDIKEVRVTFQPKASKKL